MDWQDQLISSYLFICNEYQNNLRHYIVRLSNYSDLSFSDEEVMTIYLFGTMNGYSKLKEIYNYTNKHLKDWYPKLPSYTAFVQRLNKISHLFELLTSKLIKELSGHALKGSLMSMDSMPIIIVRQGRRLKARAAKEIASPNGYCATTHLSLSNYVEVI